MQRKIIEYAVSCCDTQDFLHENIASGLRTGWEPLGPAQFYSDKDGEEGWAQTMVKYEEIPEYETPEGILSDLAEKLDDVRDKLQSVINILERDRSAL